ncbi:MAG TPA: DUF1573 domain-containing protein [Gemmataceae bacterium]|nr:DUF1573 domain-containing protein [Gemmataceae bacterium]
MKAALHAFWCWFKLPVFSAALLGGLLVIVGIVKFGSFAAFEAYVRDYPVVVLPSVNRLVSIPLFQATPARFLLTNYTPGEVTVIGVETSCGCLTPRGLPFKLNPGESRELIIHVKPRPADEGREFQHTATVYFDGHTRGLTLYIVGSVEKQERQDESVNARSF